MRTPTEPGKKNNRRQKSGLSRVSLLFIDIYHDIGFDGRATFIRPGVDLYMAREELYLEFTTLG